MEERYRLPARPERLRLRRPGGRVRAAPEAAPAVGWCATAPRRARGPAGRPGHPLGASRAPYAGGPRVHPRGRAPGRRARRPAPGACRRVLLAQVGGHRVVVLRTGKPRCVEELRGQLGTHLRACRKTFGQAAVDLDVRRQQAAIGKKRRRVAARRGLGPQGAGQYQCGHKQQRQHAAPPGMHAEALPQRRMCNEPHAE